MFFIKDKQQYRILEVMDGNKAASFYPQAKDSIFKFKWERLHDYKISASVAVEFDTFAEANEWLCKKIVVDNKKIVLKETVHKPDKVFDQLQRTTDTSKN